MCVMLHVNVKNAQSIRENLSIFIYCCSQETAPLSSFSPQVAFGNWDILPLSCLRLICGHMEDDRTKQNRKLRWGLLHISQLVEDILVEYEYHVNLPIKNWIQLKKKVSRCLPGKGLYLRVCCMDASLASTNKQIDAYQFRPLIIKYSINKNIQNFKKSLMSTAAVML